MGLVRSNYRRRREELTPIIGREAAWFAVKADLWTGVGGLVILAVCLPLALWAELAGIEVAGVVAAIVGSLGVVITVVGISVGRRSAKLASRHVAQQYGWPIQLPGCGRRRDRWIRAIERAQEHHHTKASTTANSRDAQ